MEGHYRWSFSLYFNVKDVCGQPIQPKVFQTFDLMGNTEMDAYVKAMKVIQGDKNHPYGVCRVTSSCNVNFK